MAEDPRQRHLNRLRQWRNHAEPDLSLGFLQKQFDRQVAKPHKQLGKFVTLWEACVPEPLLSRTKLESFSRGVLRVAVDSSPHLYELDQLLRGGLERQLIQQQPAGANLRRVRLHVAETPRAPR